jgi:nitrous oxide reductase accessory protein NosL
MWARTWITFHNADGRQQACSFHCLAEMTVNSGSQPEEVKVALYARPDSMIAAQEAQFVLGSRATGTMTMRSKIALASTDAGQRFSQKCGGELMNFRQALQAAQKSISQENRMIDQKRLKKGKIVEPVDHQDRCHVCEMFPARYPKHKGQIYTKDKKRIHFCSTQCLFAFKANPQAYAGESMEPLTIWVVDSNSGRWIGARSAYYVVGSKAWGPMGKEAFVFARRTAAADFAAQKGGTVLRFDEVSPAMIMR